MSQAISAPMSEDDHHFVMIPLSLGNFTIVDAADAEMILGMGKWCAIRAPRTYYAVRNEGIPQRRVYMHALIAGFKRPDHVNRNGLDNRRVNLRPATASQNNANRGPGQRGTSRYKGVCWDKNRRKWRAYVGVNRRAVYLGLFDDPEDAARAYNQAALLTFGEYAWLNPVSPLPS